VQLMVISIIIPAYNEEQLIEHTIGQIKHSINHVNNPEITWELIVCDNNSTDHTAKIAISKGAIVVKEPINQISRARNKGAEKAKGEWLLFIDADSYPSKKLLVDAIELISEGKYIGCGSTIQVEDGTLFNKLRLERMNPFFRLLKLCGGAFILCNRDAFETINGFSTDLFAYEEVDFVIRLKKYGRSIGKGFNILHQHPIVTSGRKGEYKFSSLLILFISNIAAIILFALYYILPKKFIQKLGFRWLGYWYKVR